MSDRVDEVEYNGITFRRYPDSDNRADRVYYRPASNHISNGVESLHREVWKDANDVDEIPEGYHIHHIDGDPTNNDPDNLECVSPQEHAERHPEQNLSPEAIKKGVEAAKDWHQSEEGEEWHRQHWENSLAKAFEDTEKECKVCGEVFYDSSAHDVGKFCSNACKSKHRRDSGVDDETRICEACKQPFTANKYSDKKCCGRACAGALVSWSKRVGGSND